MLGNITFYTLATIGGLMIGTLIVLYILVAFFSLNVEPFYDED